MSGRSMRRCHGCADPAAARHRQRMRRVPRAMPSCSASSPITSRRSGRPREPSAAVGGVDRRTDHRIELRLGQFAGKRPSPRIGCSIAPRCARCRDHAARTRRAAGRAQARRSGRRPRDRAATGGESGASRSAGWQPTRRAAAAAGHPPGRIGATRCRSSCARSTLEAKKRMDVE